MSGEQDIDRALAGLEPSLDRHPWCFHRLDSSSPLPSIGPSVMAVVHEQEGVTVIARADAVVPHSIERSMPLARITLSVHSSLALVGLTAAVSVALADHDISANVIAGWYHDHIFVPYDRGEPAISILQALADKTQ